jgi:dephospho-CoA kinase
MARRPYLIGLTGSIGMGKTETAKMFANLGVPVFDADAAVHALYAPGGAAVAKIAAAFPGAAAQGTVDRARLAALLQNDEAAFARLEAVVHPLVAAAHAAFVAAESEKNSDLALLSIPLLFETGLDADLETVIVVSAAPAVQRERVLARPGMSEDKFRLLLARQLPDAEKRARADFVVATDLGFDHARKDVERIIAILRQRAELHHA